MEDLLKASADIPHPQAQVSRIAVADVIAFAQMRITQTYNQKHQVMQFRVEDQVLLHLHKGYDIFFTAVLKKKLSQQYVGSFKILKRIDHLIYRLNLSQH